MYLLDVNVLVALLDQGHPLHGPAQRFFKLATSVGWATCPLTENGLLRIIGHPNYAGGAGTPAIARDLFAFYREAPGHQFWSDDISLTDKRSFPELPGPRGLTDLYLLALAVSHGGSFATFDQRFDPSLIPEGPSKYHLIAQTGK